MNKPVNIVIPMAGRGSRFQQAGYDTPKPLIPIHGVPMIQLVCRNIAPRKEHKFIFLCLEEHLRSYNLEAKLNEYAPGCDIIPVGTVTEGAACTVLLARDLIDNDCPLMIANSDQYVDLQIEDYLSAMEAERADGFIMTMWADHPKWSYVGFDDAGRVNRVVEKEVISNEATVGIYNFARGADFVRSADQMIAKEIRVNNEFYVAPVYNEMISSGARIGYYNIGRVGDGMYGLGTPDDLNDFLSRSLSRNIAQS
ncbi:MAG: glycosyltransferase family 2 protein [Leptospiraceae bacterium]|nr:glycosyltransferase family 2 protein [Leptospiraceae bacterium]